MRPYKKYERQHEEASRLDIHRATIILSESPHLLMDNDKYSEVWANINGEPHLLCNLSRANWFSDLNISFGNGDDVIFFTKGLGTVQLTGTTWDDRNSSNCSIHLVEEDIKPEQPEPYDEDMGTKEYHSAVDKASGDTQDILGEEGDVSKGLAESAELIQM